jgi:hypothetical protein
MSRRGYAWRPALSGFEFSARTERGRIDVEPYATVADVDLQPIAIVFEFMRPTVTTRRALRD